MKKYTFCLLVTLAVLFTSGITLAHFNQGTQVRVICISKGQGTLEALLAVPAPLYFSGVIDAAKTQKTMLLSNFLRFEDTGFGPRYRLVIDEINRQQLSFSSLLGEALLFSKGEEAKSMEVLEWVVVNSKSIGNPKSGKDIDKLLRDGNTKLDPVFADAIIVVRYQLIGFRDGDAITVRSTLPVLPLPKGVAVDNHLIDERAEPSVSFTKAGQLTEGVTITGSRKDSILSFIWQGNVHILKGLDHVFLVVCLALAVGWQRRLIWLVTAFTLGHCVTLITSFLGIIPDFPWFIPAVETAIALSVFATAVAALFNRVSSCLLYIFIGLIHGLGFSFVLSEILSKDSDQVVVALLSFNLGIEFGQLLIVFSTLVVMFLLKRIHKLLAKYCRLTTLAMIGIISLYWTLERVFPMIL